MQTIWGQVACIHANGGTPNTTIALNLIVCIKLQHGGGEESSYLVFVWSVNSWIVSDCRHLGGRSSSFQLMYTMVSCLHLNPCEIVCCPSMSYLGKALHSYRTQALRSLIWLYPSQQCTFVHNITFQGFLQFWHLFFWFLKCSSLIWLQGRFEAMLDTRL